MGVPFLLSPFGGFRFCKRRPMVWRYRGLDELTHRTPTSECGWDLRGLRRHHQKRERGRHQTSLPIQIMGGIRRGCMHDHLHLNYIPTDCSHPNPHAGRAPTIPTKNGSDQINLAVSNGRHIHWIGITISVHRQVRPFHYVHIQTNLK